MVRILVGSIYTHFENLFGWNNMGHEFTVGREIVDRSFLTGSLEKFKHEEFIIKYCDVAPKYKNPNAGRDAIVEFDPDIILMVSNIKYGRITKTRENQILVYISELFYHRVTCEVDGELTPISAKNNREALTINTTSSLLMSNASVDMYIIKDGLSIALNMYFSRQSSRVKSARSDFSN